MRRCLCLTVGFFTICVNVTFGAVWHIDARNGSDDNDGASPHTAWRTMEHAAKQELAAADKLLLRAGCMWRLNQSFKVKVNGSHGLPAVVSSYGDGAAPELRSSVDGLSLVWRQSANGLWWTVCEGPDVGNIVWENNGCGFKKAALAEVLKEGDFYHERHSGRLYLKSPGNPAKAFSCLELCRKIDILVLEGCRNLVVDGLAFAYTGAHGLHGRRDNHGVVVRNCIFGWIGGSFLFDPSSKYPGGLRYGNGVEFGAYGITRDVSIENCWFHDIYDVAVTNQGEGGGLLDDMVICSNRIERCEQGYEFWFSNHSYDVGMITIADNEFIDTGFGWSHDQRPNKNATHILAYQVNCKKGRIVVHGNRFGKTRQYGVWLFREGADDWLEFSGNTFDDENAAIARWPKNGRWLKIFLDRHRGI